MWSPPPKTLETIRDETMRWLNNKRNANIFPLAPAYDMRRIETVDAVIKSLESIHARLDALEKKISSKTDSVP
jgi:hypothetical protein